jgi:hydrogenase maturation protease
METIGVIGIGNTLLSDDGVGSELSRRLMAMDLPANVLVRDGGCALSDVLLSLEKPDRIIILDAVRGGGHPGDVYCFSADVLRGRMKTPRYYTSVHEFGLTEAISMAGIAWGGLPPVTVIGIEPKTLDPGMGLSEVLREKMEPIILFILSQIGSKPDGPAPR